MAHALLRICAAVPFLTAVATAHAGSTSSVSGTLTVPPSPTPPLRDAGFLDRLENPHMPVRPVDATPLIVVVLEPTGAPPAVPAPGPGNVTWDLLGASFARPLIPVLAGTEIMIRNCAACRTASLVADKPGLLDQASLSPKGQKPIKPTAPGVVTIKDAELASLRGRIVAFDVPWFTQPAADGKFEIKDVPAGSYTLKVWYDDHWIERGNETVTVEKRAVEGLKVAIPTGFPGAAQGAK